MMGRFFVLSTGIMLSSALVLTGCAPQAGMPLQESVASESSVREQETEKSEAPQSSQGQGAPVLSEPPKNETLWPETLSTERKIELFEALTAEDFDAIAQLGGVCYTEENCVNYESAAEIAPDVAAAGDMSIFVAVNGPTVPQIYSLFYSPEMESWLMLKYYNGKFEPVEGEKIASATVYEDRTSFYKEDGSAALVIYSLGRVAGAPSTRCGHESREHFIDGRLIGEVDGGAYIKWLEGKNDEAECKINIYNFLDSFELDYKDFISAFGSEAAAGELYNIDKIREHLAGGGA